MAQDIFECRRWGLPRRKGRGERIGERVRLELEPDLEDIQWSYAEAAIDSQ